MIPGALCEELRGAFLAEVAPYGEPLLRVLAAEAQPHRWDTAGRMLNPIAFPHRQRQFSRFCQTETRLLARSHLADVAEALLGGPVALLQSAYWMSSEGTAPHLDVHPLNPGAPMLGAWIALEPIGPEAGRFFVFDGSHHVPPGDPNGARLRSLGRAMWEARYARSETPPPDAAFEACLAALVQQYSWKALAPALHTGDVILWSQDTVHGSVAPTIDGGTRHSVLIHFVRADSIPDLP